MPSNQQRATPLSPLAATTFTHLRPAAASARRHQAASRLLRCASPLPVTAPRRCGQAHPWSLLREAGAQGRLPAAKTMQTESLRRAEASRLATPGLDPGGATREAGAAKGRPEGTPVFRRAMDAEHGSGAPDQEDLELRCVNPVARLRETVRVSAPPLSGLARKSRLAARPLIRPFGPPSPGREKGRAR